MCMPSAPKAAAPPPPPPSPVDENVRKRRSQFLMRHATRYGLSDSVLTSPNGGQFGSLLRAPMLNGSSVTGLGGGSASSAGGGRAMLGRMGGKP